IYELAIKKFDCIPSQTLFIDDRPENTDSAKALGINVITLDNPGKLKEYMKNFI
ncbi:MAG: haloacid dehalogenase, partial [Candidatus Pelagibacter sp.]|nr:haloacid dehalogenase [Candidatus Pelagibacter sp.]